MSSLFDFSGRSPGLVVVVGLGCRFKSFDLAGQTRQVFPQTDTQLFLGQTNKVANAYMLDVKEHLVRKQVWLLKWSRRRNIQSQPKNPRSFSILTNSHWASLIYLSRHFILLIRNLLMKFIPPSPPPPTSSSQFSKQEEIFGKIYILASALETQLMKKKITFIKIAPHKSIPLKIQVSICLYRHRLPPKQFCK